MQIRPVNMLYPKPAFSGKWEKDRADKTYKAPTVSLPYANSIEDDVVFPVDASLLPQRFNFNTKQIFDVKKTVAATPISNADKTYDSFTGLRDKNYLLASLNIAMQDALINNQNLSIAMFDMDNFKSVNELLGYETGDIFIKEISKSIISICRRNNVDAYRFGGEEFVIVFNNETDEQKMKIASEISSEANGNPKIQSYKQLYLRNAQTRLDRALYSTAKVHTLSELKTQKATIEQILDNLTSPDAKNDPYFAETLEELSLKINKVYLSLIRECLSKETNEQTKYILSTAQSKIRQGHDLLKTEEQFIDEYLYSVYDKSNEIYQTKKWLSDFNNRNGFGTTCGVVTFEPNAFENKTPMDIIGKTGNVLKNGKNKGKGRVYKETVAY